MKSHKNSDNQIQTTKFTSVRLFSGKIRSMSIYKREGVKEWTDILQVPLHQRQPLPVHSEDELPCYRVDSHYNVLIYRFIAFVALPCPSPITLPTASYQF